MKKQILIGVGVLVALTGCTQHHYIEKQTVVPLPATVDTATTQTTIVAPAQNRVILPQNNQPIIMAPRPNYQVQQPYPMPQQYGYNQQYGYAPQQQMYAPYPNQQPMPPQNMQKQREEEKPKVIRQYPMSDVNYDINKVYCCDFPVSYRKKKCTTCN